MVDYPAIHKSRSIPEVVLEQIQRLIAQGKLRPGDHLPSEMELAERFGVGRSSIREAMRVLQLVGVACLRRSVFESVQVRLLEGNAISGWSENQPYSLLFI